MRFHWAFLLVMLSGPAVSRAETPLTCSYISIRGEFVELNWFPAIDKGQEYVDFGLNRTGLCLRRAICADNVKYETKIERCQDYNVNCDNRSTFDGQFPACCVKC